MPPFKINAAQVLSPLFSMSSFAASAAALELTDTPQSTVSLGQWFYFRPAVIEPFKHRRVRFAAAHLPSWMRLNPYDGAISGLATKKGVWYDIRIAAWDGGSYDQLPAFKVTVKAAPIAVSISGAPETSAIAGHYYQFTLRNSNACARQSVVDPFCRLHECDDRTIDERDLVL